MSKIVRPLKGPLRGALGVPKKTTKVTPIDPVTIFDDLIPPFDGASFSIADQSLTAGSVRFDTSGSLMFVVGISGDSVYQYDLSDAWDISTASYSGKSFGFSGQTSQPRAVTFKDDGTSMFMVEIDDFVYQYALSTAWDVSTASYTGKSFNAGAQASNPYGVDIGNEGEAMILVNRNTGVVYQYTLSTAWDVTSASYSGKSLTQPSYSIDSNGTKYSPTGERLYVVSEESDAIFMYALSTPWDISTASLVGTINVAIQATGAYGCTFRPDGSRLYMCSSTSSSIYQYTLEAQ